MSNRFLETDTFSIDLTKVIAVERTGHDIYFEVGSVNKYWYSMYNNHKKYSDLFNDIDAQDEFSKKIYKEVVDQWKLALRHS